METEIQHHDGLQFLIRKWPNKKAKATIIIIHGLGEHSGRYEETASHLLAEGYEVISYDRRGEGASTGKRAHISDFSKQVNDLKWIVSQYTNEERPVFLYGHSLGGLILTHYLIENLSTNIKGALFSGPLLKVDDEISPFLQKISGLVSAILPGLPTVKVDTNLISRVPEERQKYIDDELVFHGATNARTGHTILKAIKYAQAHLSKIQIPLLIMHGGGDKLADPKGSHWFYEKATSTDKKIHIFEGWYHEIMREPEKEQFFDLMKNWLVKRLK